MLIQDPVKGFSKEVSESHGVDMVKDCFELGTQVGFGCKENCKKSV